MMQCSLKSVLAENVRFYRKRLHLTQFQLSELMNCSPAFIGFIENSKSNVSFDTIDSLCEALHITPNLLFTSLHEQTDCSNLTPILHEVSLILKKYMIQTDTFLANDAANHVD